MGMGNGNYSYAEMVQAMTPQQRRKLLTEPKRERFMDAGEQQDDILDDFLILEEAGPDYEPENPRSPEMYAGGIDDESRIARAWFRGKGWKFEGEQSGNSDIAKQLFEESQNRSKSLVERMRLQNEARQKK